MTSLDGPTSYNPTLADYIFLTLNGTLVLCAVFVLFFRLCSDRAPSDKSRHRDRCCCCASSKQCTVFWLFWILTLIAAARDIIVCLYHFGWPKDERDDDLFENVSVSFANAAYVYFAYVTTFSILTVAEARASSMCTRVVCGLMTGLLMINGFVTGFLTTFREQLNLDDTATLEIIGAYQFTNAMLLLAGTVTPLYNTQRIGQLVEGLQFEQRHPQHAMTLRNLTMYVYILSFFIVLSIVEQSIVGMLTLFHYPSNEDIRDTDPWRTCSLALRWLFNIATLTYCYVITAQRLPTLAPPVGDHDLPAAMEWGSSSLESSSYHAPTVRTLLGSHLDSSSSGPSSRRNPSDATSSMRSSSHGVAAYGPVVSVDLSNRRISGRSGASDSSESLLSHDNEAVEHLREEWAEQAAVRAAISSSAHKSAVATRASWSINMENSHSEHFAVSHSYPEEGYGEFDD